MSSGITYRSLLMPSGIVFSNGHIWKEQRHIGITSLRKLGLGKKSVEHQIEDTAQTLVETFKKTKGQPFDPSIPVINAVSNIICTLSFGHQFAPEDEGFQKLIQAVEIIVKVSGSFFHLMFVAFPRLMSYFPGPHKEALAGADLIVSFAKQEIEKHKESSCLHEPQDFIDHYLLQMEKDRKKLPYTNAVIHEIQRLKYILLVGLTRQSTKDVTMKSYHIPKRTIIIPDMRSVLLDPEQWETPEEFNPNHFLDKDGKFMEREEFLPFGIGKRICVGEQLARIEIFIFLTNLLRAFSFRLPEGVKELNEAPIVNVSMHPHPYKLCAIPTKA
ncbi:cytochrome P450 2J2-like [Crotalus adamanteus]|uniref:Cytochrome P450 2J2-like n=1 Tax=Crotalus adamanteus TaxID=8729 RepID=A0AAW1BHW3_CROAD